MHPAGMDEPWDVPQVDLTLPRAFIFLSQRPRSPASVIWVDCGWIWLVICVAKRPNYKWGCQKWLVYFIHPIYKWMIMVING